MNKLRKEVLKLLASAECIRPAVLRRSLREDALYATDLPKVAAEPVLMEFCRRAEAAGWHTAREGDWIQLDQDRTEPPEGGFSGPYGKEAGCCKSLLLRHPERERNTGAREKRRLIKAGEKGPEDYEKVCSMIHQEWAGVLRRGEKLPDIPIAFFEGGKSEEC